jgi:hypothetical protein
MAEQREGSRYFEAHSLRLGASHRAQETPETHLANDRSRISVDLDTDFGSEPEQALCQREIRLCRKRLRIRKRIGSPKPPLSGKICEHVRFDGLGG